MELESSHQKIRKTCVLMGPFGKYILFGTQLYEIWKLAFDMKNYIFFMHSKQTAFFVLRLPPFFFFLPYPPSASPLPPQWNRPAGVITGCHSHLSPVGNLPLSPFPFPLSFPFDITKREEGGGNGGEPRPEGRKRGWLLLAAATSNSRGHWRQ